MLLQGVQHSQNSLSYSGVCWAPAAQRRYSFSLSSVLKVHSPVWVQVVNTEVLSALCAWVLLLEMDPPVGLQDELSHSWVYISGVSFCNTQIHFSCDSILNVL